ncbi:MAG: hypothetical protein ACI9KN_002046 [Gammaproteobacteria bacterium]|jgi:hypothetical protein
MREGLFHLDADTAMNPQTLTAALLAAQGRSVVAHIDGLIGN